MFNRIILLLVIVVMSFGSSQLFADANQERRVTISAKIFPRIVAVDQDLSQKLDENGNVKLGLIYRSEKEKAKKLAKLMTRKVKKIAGYKVIIELINIAETELDQHNKLSGIFFVQPIADKELKKLQQFVIQKNILCFSPFEGDIERGVMASIFVGAKIRPYFNLSSIEKASINLKPALLKVSKTYE